MAFSLSSLTDIFTGAPQQKAAEQQRAYLAQQQAAEQARIAASQGTGIEALKSGQAGAIGAIQGGTGTARSDVMANTPEALGALYGGQTFGAGALTAGQEGGLAALQSGVSGALGAYDPLSALSQKYGSYADPAASLLTGALGAASPEQRAAAVSAFQSSPGYQFQVGQGIDALTRAANVGGGVAGGNVLREAQTFGQGLADQDYQQWIKNLQAQQAQYSPLEASTATSVAAGKVNPYLTGATGAANIYTGTGGKLADLYSATGTNAANIYTGQGTTLANLAQGGGLAQGNVYTGTGTGIAGLISNLSGQQTSYDQSINPQYAKTYADAAAAQTGGSQNLWNLIGGGAQLAAGAGWLPTGTNKMFGPLAPKTTG